MDDSWRPDKSGVLIERERTDIPPNFPQFGWKLILVDSPNVILDEQFVRFIVGNILARIPIFLSIPGPPGYKGRKVFLNNGLAGVVASQDYGQVVKTLEKIIEIGTLSPQKKVEFRD